VCGNRTRDLGLHVYAERFAAAGMAVLVFDYRHFGASGERIWALRRRRVRIVVPI
jgi:hypothetical protein